MSALHVHSSFSEGAGSMHAQLAEASALGVRALWWTDHDWRMSAHGYADHLSPAALDGDGTTWVLDPDSVGSAGSHLAVEEAADAPGLPGRTLQLEVAGGGRPRVEHRLLAHSDRSLYSTSLHGQEWTIPVYLEERQDRSFLAVDFLTSWRPAEGGRSPGPYRLSYRFSDHRDGMQVLDHVVEIYIRVPLDEWSEVVVRPAADLTEAWPEIDGRDASCTQLSVAALAWDQGATRGRVGDLRIARDHVEGQEPAVTQRDIMSRYATEFPDVHQMQGVELSSAAPHICWYGGGVRLPAEHEGPPTSAVPEIENAGGVAVFAHPFGVGGGTLSRPEQNSMVAERADELTANAAHGCAAMEVGYRLRGGADLESHESLWDTCSRRGLFLTGVGVSDNHSGLNWATQTNNFVTWLWSVSTEQDDLLAALHQGHAFFGDPVRFSGRLDLRCGDSCHMGQVATTDTASMRLRLVATDLPPTSQLELIRFDMNPESPPSATEDGLLKTYRPAELDAGEVMVDIPTTTDCFVRTRVRQASGEVIALSNPLWLVGRSQDYSVPSSRQDGTSAHGRARPWW